MKQNIAVEPSENLLTIPEVAKALRVDSTTVRRWIGIGALDAVALPHARKRKAYRIKESVLARMLGA